MSKASVLVNDIINPEYEMFHAYSHPPVEVKIVTARNPSKIALISLYKLTAYLSEMITPDFYLHHQTDTLLMNDGSVLDLDENTIIVRTGYENGPDRTFTFQLTTDSALVKFH